MIDDPEPPSQRAREACYDLDRRGLKLEEAVAKYTQANTHLERARVNLDKAWGNLKEERAKHDEAVAEVKEEWPEFFDSAGLLTQAS